MYFSAAPGVSRSCITHTFRFRRGKVMTPSAFMESTEGLITACGGLLTGLGAVLTALRQLRGSQRRRQREGVEAHRSRSYWSYMALAGIVLIIVSTVVLGTRALSTAAQGLNVELTAAAWNAFNRSEFPVAIANADKCITEFKGAADRDQAELQRSYAALPPTGSVPGDIKTAILNRGLLNDVATCFYIKGRAAEALARREDAREAYRSASTYSYARCWDTKGWFWSPAEASLDRLAIVK